MNGSVLISNKEGGSEKKEQEIPSRMAGTSPCPDLRERKPSVHGKDLENQNQNSDKKCNWRTSVAKAAAYLKPNKKLIAIKLHFFWSLFGIAPLLLFLPVMIRQRGVSPEGIGVIWTAMPVAGLLAGASLSSVIDHFKIHRFCFILSIIISPVPLSVIYWLPHIDGKSFEVQAANSSSTICLRGNFSDTEVYLYDVASDHEDILTNSSCVPFSGNVTEILRISETLNQTFGYEGLEKARNSSYSANNSTDEELQLSHLIQRSGFWIIMICVLGFNFGYFLSRNVTDSVCFMLLGDKSHLYGQQRLFTSFSWGLSALVTGVVIDMYSAGLSYKDYFPAFIMVVVFSAIDLVIGLRLKIPVPEKEKDLTPKDFLGVVVQPENILFFVTSSVAHVALNIIFTFCFLLVEDVANAWQPNFSALKTLQGLIIVVRCFAGEAPVFITSGTAIRKLGVPGCLVLVLLAFAIRFLLYSIITNPWYFLPVEVLHGFNFGLFKAVISYNANEIAPKGTATTMLTVLRMTMFAGKSISGLTGGLLWSWAGGHGTFLTLGLIFLAYTVFYAICNFLIHRCKRTVLQVTPA